MQPSINTVALAKLREMYKGIHSLDDLPTSDIALGAVATALELDRRLEFKEQLLEMYSRGHEMIEEALGIQKENHEHSLEDIVELIHNRQGSLERTHQWLNQALPLERPDAKVLRVQVGCAFEEFSEFIYALGREEFTDLAVILDEFGAKLKEGTLELHLVDINLKEFADGGADVCVTVDSSLRAAGINLPKVLDRINESNYSKFVDGVPTFHPNGKLAKGPNFKPPVLDDLLPDYSLVTDHFINRFGKME